MADAWGDVNLFKPPLTGSLPIGCNPASKKPSSQRHTCFVIYKLFIRSPLWYHSIFGYAWADVSF